MKTVQ